MNQYEIIPALHVGQGTSVGAVTVFPVWAQVPAVTGLRTGAAAAVEVAELDSGPAVGRLSVYNPGDHPVLLVEGELLEGGWQTRVCARDAVVFPREWADLEVTCVEQHRWSGGGTHDRRARRATPTVHRALRTSAATRQATVWSGVARHEQSAPTASGSLAHHLDRLSVEPLPPVLNGQNGVIVGVGGHPVALELFGTRAALRAHLPGIVAAAALEAEFSTPTRVPGRRARRFAARVERTCWAPSAQQTGGWEGGDDHVDLRALTVGRGLAHLAAVATAP